MFEASSGVASLTFSNADTIPLRQSYPGLLALAADPNRPTHAAGATSALDCRSKSDDLRYCSGQLGVTASPVVKAWYTRPVLWHGHSTLAICKSFASLIWCWCWKIQGRLLTCLWQDSVRDRVSQGPGLIGPLKLLIAAKTILPNKTHVLLRELDCGEFLDRRRRFTNQPGLFSRSPNQ